MRLITNRYVDFVSDSDFLECVKWVCDAYRDVSTDIDMKVLQKNRLDPIKMLFDTMKAKISLDAWIKNEEIRQRDKTINNRIGEFHQKLLGKVKGWTNLGVGDDSHVDLKKNDNTIFIELKNKYNTVNDDSLSKVRQKLEMTHLRNLKSTSYWAFIISPNGTSGESLWKYKGREENPRIRKIWGSKVYELVTGDKDALRKVWEALPLAINDLGKSDFKFDSNSQKRLLEFFEAAFEQ